MLRKSLSERKLLQFPGRWQGLQEIGQKLIAATDKSLPALKADLQLHVVSTSLLLARAYLEVKQLYRSIYYLVYLDVVTPQMGALSFYLGQKTPYCFLPLISVSSFCHHSAQLFLRS